MPVSSSAGRACLRVSKGVEQFISTSHRAAVSSRSYASFTKRCITSSQLPAFGASYGNSPAALSQSLIAFGNQKRGFSATHAASHNHLDAPKAGEELKITFIDKEGDEHTFDVAKGDNLLDIALEHDIEMEGACGGSCACSTCHIIVENEDMYEKMDEPDDDENDMLDLAFGLTETSRLGCQVKMRPELDGLRVRLPSMTRNLQASDFSKKNERSD